MVSEIILAYCRQNKLPPPTANQLFLRKDGADLLLTEDPAGRMNIWADLGKTGEFRNEENVLAAILETASRLDPMHGIFLGLHAPSQRIMLRAAFSWTASDGAKPLDDLLAAMAVKVKEIKASLHDEANH
jgi:hypothetical protein